MVTVPGDPEAILRRVLGTICSECRFGWVDLPIGGYSIEHPADPVAAAADLEGAWVSWVTITPRVLLDGDPKWIGPLLRDKHIRWWPVIGE